MSPLRRQAAVPPGLSAAERWTQAVKDGQVRLDSFTPAELDCATVDPEFLAGDRQGPALLAVGQVMSVLAAQRADAEPQLAAPAPAVLAQAAADLDRRGYLRPGWPAKQDGPVPFELAGWSADPAGGTELRQVTILGDLGIVGRARVQPGWVAEAAEPHDRLHPDPGTAAWGPVGRMYATHQPSAGVVELSPRRDGSAQQFSLLWQERAVWALWTWAGIDLDEMRYSSNPAFTEQVPDAPTAEIAGEFTSVRSLRVVHPAGERVLVRTLIAAAAGRRHWILEGEHAERAVRVSVNQLGERIQSLIQPGEPL